MGINSLITYIFASRGRVKRFFSCLDNIQELSVSGNYEIICSLDEDDETMNNDEVKERLLFYPKVKAYYGISDCKITAINRGISNINPETKIIICMSDDFEFLVKGFDVQIRNDMARLFPDTDGVLHYDDGTMNGRRLMTMSILGKKYFDRFGYIYHPDYKSVYVDNEETEKARLLGKYFYSPKSIFKHKHWLFNENKKDELNIRNDAPEMYAHDSAVFNKRKQTNFGL